VLLCVQPLHKVFLVECSRDWLAPFASVVVFEIAWLDVAVSENVIRDVVLEPNLSQEEEG
jgi:hypothetical protein